jgi:DNA-binding NarL/FixJ family response regulator
MKRIMLVDDHPIVRQGLAALVRRRTGHEICGEAGDAETALEMARRLKPDLLIVDISLGSSSGLDLLKQLHVDLPGLVSLVVSMHDEALYGERAITAGARGYVMKDKAPEQIEAAIEQVLCGRIYTSPALTERLLQKVLGRPAPAATAFEALSDRELQVFESIGRGRSTRGIAADLHLSVKTIESYRANIKDKLGLTSGTELVQRAVLWVQSR